MGLFDLIGKSKRQKEIDRIIEKAKNYIEKGDYTSARNILYEIVMSDDETDCSYRWDEVEELYAKSSTPPEKNLQKKPQEPQYDSDHKAQKDEYIQKVYSLYQAGKYNEVLETVEYMDAHLASDYRSEDMGALYDIYHDSDSRLQDAKEGRYAEAQESAKLDADDASNTEADESLFSSDLPLIDEEMRKKMQDDAYRRLGELADLGMSSNVFVNCLADLYYCCCVEEDGSTQYVEISELPREYQIAIKTFEESEPGMVYHSILREGRLYMLYVSAYPSTWVDEGVFVNKKYYKDENAKGYSIGAEVYEPGNDGTKPVDIHFYIKDSAIVVVKEVEYGTRQEHVFEEWPENICGGEESAKPDADAVTETAENPPEEASASDAECNSPQFIEGKDAAWWFDESIKYYEGKGVEADTIKALECMEKAADNGHMAACIIMANICRDEEGFDKTKVLRWYETAAQQGNSDAMVKCMDMYRMGEGCEEDEEKAIYWGNKALEAKNAEMLFRIGNEKLNETKVNRDLKEVFGQYLIPSANQGHSSALCVCGYAYLVGTFFEQDKKRGIELIEISAEKGNEVAVKLLYELYTKGDLIAADSEKAFYWLEQLAKTGDTEAIRQVAEAYENTENSKKAMFWYKKLAQAGDADAMYKVFDVLYKNPDSEEISEEDAEAAGFLVMHAADSGHPEALEIVTQMFIVNKDYDGALQYGLKSAENGDIFAMRACADIYLDGKSSTGKDLKKALYWFEKAAQSGDIADMIICAMLYVDETGEIPVNKERARYWLDPIESALENSTKQDVYCEGVADLYCKCARDKKDLSKAFYWYEKSALNGTRNSIYNCAMMCLHGDGCEKNYDKAMEFAELAAEQGDNGDMLAQIADIFRDGKEGLSVNETEAMRWYKRAGECGSVYAMAEYASAHFSEDGTSGNNGEAFYWYRKAAEAGKVRCMTMVGLMYAQGIGTVQDDRQAFYWLNKAAEAGDDVAMMNAGGFYLSGKGGAPRDLHKARELFERASKSDVQEVSDFAELQLLFTEDMIKRQK